MLFNICPGKTGLVTLSSCFPIMATDLWMLFMCIVMSHKTLITTYNCFMHGRKKKLKKNEYNVLFLQECFRLGMNRAHHHEGTLKRISEWSFQRMWRNVTTFTTGNPLKYGSLKTSRYSSRTNEHVQRSFLKVTCSFWKQPDWFFLKYNPWTFLQKVKVSLNWRSVLCAGIFKVMFLICFNCHIRLIVNGSCFNTVKLKLQGQELCPLTF